jgi:hypothetical protein
MAIGQNFLTGRMRKSAGGTRFSTWKGLNIVAAKPISVRQNVTAAVQLNRDKMSVVGKFVSHINGVVGLFYNFGIQKTTPFADSVKFFRNRLLDTLKLDPSLLSDAKFGTGNAEGLIYTVDDLSVSGFQITAESSNNGNPLWDGLRQSTVLVFNDSLTKVMSLTDNYTAGDGISLALDDFGFVVGDKISFAVKDIKFRPGSDLAGKVKCYSGTSFITLTA